MTRQMTGPRLYDRDEKYHMDYCQFKWCVMMIIESVKTTAMTRMMMIKIKYINHSLRLGISNRVAIDIDVSNTNNHRVEIRQYLK